MGSLRGTVAASLIVVAATAAGSGANFLFQWLAARRLAPAEFSLLAAMLAVVTIALLPGPALAIAIVRRLAGGRGGGARASWDGVDTRGGLPGAAPGLARARRVGIAAGLALLALIAAAGTLGGDRLHLADGGGPLLWLAAAAVVASWLAIAPDLARVQAAGDFPRYGRAQAHLAGSRLLFGGGALLAGAGPGVALLLLAAGPWLVRALLPRLETGAELRAPWLRELLPSLAATGGLQALVVLDVVFARAHFAASDPEGAGSYAVCSTLARALFHLPFAITAVTVERTSAASAAGLPRRGILLANLGIAAAFVAAGALALGCFPRTALAVFAGGDPTEGEVRLLGRLLLPMALASLAAVPAHYLLSAGSRAPMVILGAAPLVLAALLARPVATVEDLIAPLTAVQGATLGALLVATFSSPAGRGRGTGPRSAGTPGDGRAPP